MVIYMECTLGYLQSVNEKKFTDIIHNPTVIGKSTENNIKYIIINE